MERPMASCTPDGEHGSKLGLGEHSHLVGCKAISNSTAGITSSNSQLEVLGPVGASRLPLAGPNPTMLGVIPARKSVHKMVRHHHFGDGVNSVDALDAKNVMAIDGRRPNRRSGS
jgi:hypothetical protein